MEFYEEYLNNNGGILMEFYKDMMSKITADIDMVKKVLFLLILRKTDSDVIEALEGAGLVGILHDWFVFSHAERDVNFIAFILEAFKSVPQSSVYIDEVKNLSNLEDPGVIKKARELIMHWNSRSQNITNNDFYHSSSLSSKKKFSTVKIRKTDMRTAGIEDEEVPVEERVTKKPNRVDLKVKARNLPQLDIPNVILQSPTSVTPTFLEGKPKKRVSWAPPETFKKIMFYDQTEIEADNHLPIERYIDNMPNSKFNVKNINIDGLNTSKSEGITDSLRHIKIVSPSITDNKENSSPGSSNCSNNFVSNGVSLDRLDIVQMLFNIVFVDDNRSVIGELNQLNVLDVYNALSQNKDKLLLEGIRLIQLPK